MAYQQPTAFFTKPTELTSEDFLNGVRTQDAAETYRRKRALADAFSKSITTKPVIADEDKVDASGNIIQRKGDIIARPGDVDQQKFFEHSAKAGLGFDEAAAVYNHYDMQKKAALSALKTGNEIDALGGGTGVEGRAGAPVFRGQAAQQQGTTGLGGQVQPAPEAPAVAPAPVDELAGLSDEKKIDKLTRWMNSKKKDLVAKAQGVLGAPVDGVSGKKTRMAMSDFKDALIKSNLQKDVTQGAQNRVDVISSTPSKGAGKGQLVADDAFNTQPARIGQIEDTRTSLQVIEDRGAGKGQLDTSAATALKAPKLADFANKKLLAQVLGKVGLPVSDEGIQNYIDRQVSATSNFTDDPSKGIFERRALFAKNLADKQAKFNEAIKELSGGQDIAQGQALAKDANRMANIASAREKMLADQNQEALDELKKTYGVTKATVADIPKLRELAGKKEKTKTLVESTNEFLNWAKKNPKASMEERETHTKVIDNLLRQADNITTDAGNNALFSTMSRIAPSWKSALYNSNGDRKKIDVWSYLSKNIGELTPVQQATMYSEIAKDIDKNGSAENELKAYRTGGARKQLEDKAKKAKLPVRSTEGM